MGKSQLTCLLLVCVRFTTQELEIQGVGSIKLADGHNFEVGHRYCKGLAFCVRKVTMSCEMSLSVDG